MDWSRRDIFRQTAIAVPTLALPGLSRAQSTGRSRRYLLVHGSWHGGWCWRDVAQRMRQAGHEVYTPTLTGLGERSHLLTSETSLKVHIEDIANVIRCEELQDFIIVGHSYAGVVITGVCDQFRDRIRHAVYIDAASPHDGGSNAGGQSLAKLREELGMTPGTMFSPPNDKVIALLGVIPSDGDRFDWVKRRLTPHPLRTWTDILHLSHAGSDGLPRTFIFCNKAATRSPIRIYADSIRSNPSWNYLELPSGHDAMVLIPDQTADLLMKIADAATCTGAITC